MYIITISNLLIFDGRDSMVANVPADFLLQAGIIYRGEEGKYVLLLFVCYYLGYRYVVS